MGDSISRFGDELERAIDSLPYEALQFVLRGLIVFGLPILAGSISLRLGNRSTHIQWVVFIASFAAGLTIPLEGLFRTRLDIGYWIILVGGSLLAVLPSVLPGFLFSRRGTQVKARVAGYVFLFLMMVSGFG